jgi:predicted nucleic acid-binding protein
MELAEKHGLRGYDAVQLASALVVHAELLVSGVSELLLICADTNLNEVAQVENLSVQNPNDHA